MTREKRSGFCPLQIGPDTHTLLSLASVHRSADHHQTGCPNSMYCAQFPIHTGCPTRCTQDGSSYIYSIYFSGMCPNLA